MYYWQLSLEQDLFIGYQNSRNKFLIVAFAIAYTIVFAQPANATTDVSATICTGATGSSLTIDTPKNDSVVSEPEVRFKGSVSNATQIDVQVNGQATTTVPLNANQQVYDFTLGISEGTSTISLVANDICQLQNDTSTVVITYEPEAKEASEGGTLPTSTGGTDDSGENSALDSSDGSTNLSRGNEDNSFFQGMKSMPIAGPVFGLGEKAGEWMGVASLAASEGALVATARIVGFSAGISMTAFTGVLMGFVRPRWIMLINDFSYYKLSIQTSWLVRSGGVVLATMALLL
jgi:hypothetical protein